MQSLVSPNSPQSLDIGQNLDIGISDFWISGQSFIKENCHNSRTSADIDTKVTKLDKRNKTTSKDFDDAIMLTNCDYIVIFSDLWPIWSYLEAGFQMHNVLH